MKFYLFYFLTFIFLDSDRQAVSNKIITIDPYLSFQNYEHFKRLTLSSPDSRIEYLEGFNFEWGYTYKLSVTEIKLDRTMSDGTQYDYAFNHIVSKTKMPDTSQFKLFLNPNRYTYELDSSEQEMNITLVQLNDSTFSYFDKVEIEVPHKLKTEFNKVVLGKFPKLGHFTYLNENRIKLVWL
jgi:hypothetical protein